MLIKPRVGQISFACFIYCQEFCFSGVGPFTSFACGVITCFCVSPLIPFRVDVALNTVEVNNVTVPSGFSAWELWVAFPGESQL